MMMDGTDVTLFASVSCFALFVNERSGFESQLASLCTAPYTRLGSSLFPCFSTYLPQM